MSMEMSIKQKGQGPPTEQHHSSNLKKRTHSEACGEDQGGEPGGAVSHARLAEQPSDANIEAKIRVLVRNTSLEQLSIKRIRDQLTEYFGTDMSDKKELIRSTVDRVLEEMADEPPDQDQQPAADEAGEDINQDDENEVEEDDSGDEEGDDEDEEEEDDEGDNEDDNEDEEAARPTAAVTHASTTDGEQ
ncbi:unnamed protein product [Vitrella brassicaformis CCMP3155]|uniref:DEK-C domain-containing protein n=2 Tax=Vitrella brassicaformis TaxID=1169539 RepID=A0A0G4FLE7_VITBC|nr:unnamed protein product [Vitrella brassicaformis CCMP3155]|eukprot:CEM14830.1 unnamed protein product [Vitrella brassicaformis CCMP3155]